MLRASSGKLEQHWSCRCLPLSGASSFRELSGHRRPGVSRAEHESTALKSWKNRSCSTFAGCECLFQLGNASMLPLAGEALVFSKEAFSSLIVSALIIVPQLIVALMAWWAGRRANTWGRRPLLLVGFAALPIRALVFAWTTSPMVLIAAQILDGVSGTMLGVLTALIVSDLTQGYRAVQPSAWLRWDDVRNRHFAQHYTHRPHGRELWSCGGISEHRSRGPRRSASPLVADARNRSVEVGTTQNSAINALNDQS